jgi:hypothetical protein
MDSDAIFSEARIIMDRANRVQASPDDVLKILTIVMGQLLHEHAADIEAAGQVMAHLHFGALGFWHRFRQPDDDRVLH